MRLYELRLTGTRTHYGTHANDWLCMRDTPMEWYIAHAWTTDRTKVTCQPCLEWLHA